MLLLDHIPTLILALAIDALVGDPNWIYRKIPHPVAVMGFLISKLDLFLNIPNWPYLSRKLLGILALFVAHMCMARHGCGCFFSLRAYA